MNYEKEFTKAIKRNDIEKIEELFEGLYYEYGKLIGFVISKYVSKKEDIEELVNDVFLQFSRVLFDIKLNNIKYYLVTTAKNASINFLKRKDQKLNVEYSDEYISSVKENNVDNNKYYELVFDMEKYLSVLEINIIILHSVYGYSFKEIGIKYQKPTSSISSIYQRAIDKYNKRRVTNDQL